MQLQVKKLHKNFEGIRAVNDVTINFKPHEITGLIGPNGSGKSTLINLLTGFIEFDSGVVIVGENLRLSKIKPYDVSKLHITRTFQDIKLFEQMTVLDNILVVLTSRSVIESLFEKETSVHEARAEEVLKKVNLWEHRNKLAINLSYGQRKLLEISRAMAMDAKIYFFDEPFAGLFPEVVKTITSILRDLRDTGNTVILVEHNMEIIRKLSDYCIVMDAGKILAEGTPEEVLSKKEVVEAYLGE